MNWNRIFVGAVALALSGCAAYQQQQVQEAAAAKDAAFHAALDKATKKCEAFYTDAAIDPIRARITILHPENAPLSQLSDASIPTRGDLAAIDAFETERRRCAQEMFNVAISYSPPEISQALQRAQGKSWDLSRDFYSQRLTFGAFNTARAEIARQLADDVSAGIVHARQMALEQQRQAEERQRDRQSAALALYGAALASRPPPVVPYVPVAPAPVVHPVVTTNCNRFGSTVNCTSY